MYTRVQNGILCTQEYKVNFTVEVVEIFSSCSGYFHYILTFVNIVVILRLELNMRTL